MEESNLRPYLEVVYLRCMQLLQNQDKARDALQEVFARFLESKKKREISNPIGYLYKTSTNYCLSVLKKEKRFLPMTQELLEYLGEKTHNPAEARLNVEKIIKEFGEEQLQLMVYRHIDQMTYQEIAELYGLSDRGIKKRLDQLEKKVKKHFMW